MRRILCSVGLLWLCYAQAAYGQALTLDQLVNLQGKDQLGLNDYLTQHGWHFANSSHNYSGSMAGNENTFKATWNFKNARRQQLAEVECEDQGYGFPSLTYSTDNKVVFDAIRAKITSYNMTYKGPYGEGRLGAEYLGEKYHIWIWLTDEDDGILYHTAITYRPKT